MVINCSFNNFEGLELWFLGKFTLENVKSFKNSKFRAGQMIKMTVFWAAKWPKLISRKMWVAEKSCNFHIVNSHLSCLGLYYFKMKFLIVLTFLSNVPLHFYKNMRPHSKLFWKKNGSTVGDCVNFGSSGCCNPPAVASDEKQGCLPSKRASATLLWQ